MQLYQVKKVIDGDTFMVDPPISLPQLDFSNKYDKVRLANLNAEESSTPKGIQATLYLKELIEGKHVTLNPIEISFDRVVAEVWRYPNKVYINAMIVYSGYATWVEKTSIE